jgi:hypothetical protein
MKLLSKKKNLAFLQGPPDGSGDMAHVLAKVRANFEGFLASEEPKTPDVILARITEEIEDLGPRRWPGSLQSLKPPRSGTGDGVAAYAADAATESSRATDAAAGSAQQPSPGKGPIASDMLPMAVQHLGAGIPSAKVVTRMGSHGALRRMQYDING